MQKDNARVLADIHTQLSSESRLRILRALAASPTSVKDLAVAVGITLPATSSQLQKMRAQRMVDFSRDGGSIVYHLTEPVHPIVAGTLALMENGR